MTQPTTAERAAITETRTVELTFETLAKVAAWAGAVVIALVVVVWQASSAATDIRADIAGLKADVADLRCTIKPSARGCWQTVLSPVSVARHP